MRREEEAEPCLEDKIQIDFSSNALDFLFCLNNLLDNRLREAGFQFKNYPDILFYCTLPFVIQYYTLPYVIQ